MTTVLVTGGAGFIGSHACLELLNANFDVIVLDNFYNSKAKSIQRIKKVTGKSIILIEGDVRDKITLTKLFSNHQIDAVMHFAGLKAVSDSVKNPLSSA